MLHLGAAAISVWEPTSVNRLVIFFQGSLQFVQWIPQDPTDIPQHSDRMPVDEEDVEYSYVNLQENAERYTGYKVGMVDDAR